jgi:hypothetical protein
MPVYQASGMPRSGRHLLPAGVARHRFRSRIRRREQLMDEDVCSLNADAASPVSSRTIPCGAVKFGLVTAKSLRRRRPRASDRCTCTGESSGLPRPDISLTPCRARRRRFSTWCLGADGIAGRALRLMRGLLTKQEFCAEVAGNRQPALLRLGVPLFGDRYRAPRAACGLAEGRGGSTQTHTRRIAFPGDRLLEYDRRHADPF